LWIERLLAIVLVAHGVTILAQTEARVAGCWWEVKARGFQWFAFGHKRDIDVRVGWWSF